MLFYKRWSRCPFDIDRNGLLRSPAVYTGPGRECLNWCSIEEALGVLTHQLASRNEVLRPIIPKREKVSIYVLWAFNVNVILHYMSSFLWW